MHNHPKYEISEFAELERTKGFGEDLEIRFAARIAVLYYIYACHEMFSFCEINNELFQKHLPEEDPQIPIYTSRAWAAAFGMYALLRTVLEATQKVRKHHSGLDWSDNVYAKSIGRIIDTVNDVVKHPMFNGEGSKAYMPEQGISIDGTIELTEFTGLDNLSSTRSLSPEKDLVTVTGYMNYLAKKVKFPFT